MKEALLRKRHTLLFVIIIDVLETLLFLWGYVMRTRILSIIVMKNMSHLKVKDLVTYFHHCLFRFL